MTQQLLSPKKVAEMLDISIRQVYYQMEAGNIPYIKIGRSRRTNVAHVNRFIMLLERKMRAGN